jgi:hypothetical protein
MAPDGKMMGFLVRIRRGLPALPAIAVAVGLIGCETLWPSDEAPTPSAQPAAAVVDPLPSPPPRKPQPPGNALARLPPSAGEVEAPPAAAPPVEAAPMVEAALPPPAALPAPAPPPAPSVGNLDRLIGLDQPHVAGILGEPRSRAESSPATIWRFAGSNCDLDVYFYLDLRSQAMRALHYEVRSHDAPEQSAQRCYETLVSERRTNAEPAAGSDRPR